MRIRHWWRWFRWWYRHAFVTYLEIDDMPAGLIIDASIPGPHKATLTALNLDSTPATDVDITYSSSNLSVVTVDSNTGNITTVGNGECIVTGTAQRGVFTHTDQANVSVINFGADFTVSMAAS